MPRLSSINITTSIWLPPTLTLTGQNPQIIQQGSTFTDPGATTTVQGTYFLQKLYTSAAASCRGTHHARRGLALGSHPEFTLTYSVTDSGGLTAKQARTVAVVPPGNLQPTEAEVTDYFPYGSQRFDTGSYQSQRKFIGQYYDPSSDLSFLNARYYNGSTGQFLSQDPVFWWNSQNLTNPQSLNSYSYANGNPIGNKDPMGLFNMMTGQIEKGDTLSKITNQINSAYQTSLTTQQVAKANHVEKGTGTFNLSRFVINLSHGSLSTC